MHERFVRSQLPNAPRSRHGLFRRPGAYDIDANLSELATSAALKLFAALHEGTGRPDDGMSALFWEDQDDLRNRTVRAIRDRAPSFRITMGRAIALTGPTLNAPAGLDHPGLRSLSAEFLQRLSFVVGGNLASDTLIDAYARMLSEYVVTELRP